MAFRQRETGLPSFVSISVLYVNLLTFLISRIFIPLVSFTCTIQSTREFRFRQRLYDYMVKKITPAAMTNNYTRIIQKNINITWQRLTVSCISQRRVCHRCFHEISWLRFAKKASQLGPTLSSCIKTTKENSVLSTGSQWREEYCSRDQISKRHIGCLHLKRN